MSTVFQILTLLGALGPDTARSTGYVPVRNDHDERRASESRRQPSALHSLGHDRQFIHQNPDRYSYNGNHSVFQRDDGDDRQFRQCRTSQPYAGGRCHHGRQYRHDRHIVAHIFARLHSRYIDSLHSPDRHRLCLHDVQVAEAQEYRSWDSPRTYPPFPYP